MGGDAGPPAPLASAFVFPGFGPHGSAVAQVQR